MFIDNPTEVWKQLQSDWIGIRDGIDTIRQEIEASVTQWQYTDDQLLIPNHPLNWSIDTSESDGYWKDRKTLFGPAPKQVYRQVKHGFDQDHRIVIAQREWYSFLVMYSDTFHDITTAHKSDEDAYTVNPERPRFTRCNLDERQRIISTYKYSPAESDHLTIEMFQWNDDRIVASFRQSFEHNGELPNWAKDDSPEVNAARFRIVTPELREFMPSQEILTYAYDKLGILQSVQSEATHKSRSSTVYTRNTNDTIESVSLELQPLLVKQIAATLKKAKKAHPLHRVALIYSAEHAHCGLPTSVACRSNLESDADRFDIEAFPVEAVWPPEKRTGQTLRTLTNRLLIAVDALPEFRDVDAPQPFRELLWKVCRDLQSQLSGEKWIDSDFAIYPLDDHGDVDAMEDFEKSRA
ncbi:hypothetical protein Poly24_31040 [Rosistilla carotiformis]|uniref:Uncharacterized protein n=1 Tax=Rosistilla carotiformis TaxID=2528017 RepID=A0A518JV36_9BACT|nr:hypothetical protein [Rosistilla carotiformis]QDV69388.1 hypothetical protein Poly24_31040 [Rosistilla carotiformis]